MAGRRGTQRKRVALQGRKPAIVRAKDPLTRESLASTLEHTDLSIVGSSAADAAPSGAPATGDETTAAEAAALGHLQGLWDTGVVESAQYAAKLREVAVLAPRSDDMDLRDEAEYLVAQALRTTIGHASRLLSDAQKATAHLPQLLGLLETGVLPARWFTFVLRRSGDLTTSHLSELDGSIAGWDLRVEEDRFRRRLNALVQWLRDRDEATSTTPQRSVDVSAPDEDGISCLQLQGPAPEILSLGRRLDSAARAIQQDQRRAIATGQDIPFDDGTAAATGKPLPLARLRYEILTRSVLDTGTTQVPRERFRFTVTVPALTLLGVENAPGMLDGIHPIPPQMARELAASEDTWYRMLTDPTTGAFLPLPADRYVPTPEMLEYLRLVFPVCAVPGCTRPTSWASQIDHIQEYHHAHPESGGKTEIANLHPLCWRHHQMKTAGILDPIKESVTHAVTTLAPDRDHGRSAHADDTSVGDPESPESTSRFSSEDDAPVDTATTATTATEHAPHEDAPAKGSLPDDRRPGDSPGSKPPGGAPPGDEPPGKPPSDNAIPTRAAPGQPSPTETVTRFEPGATSWTIRGGPPRLILDECDLMTPWLVNAFTTRWNEYQQRLATGRNDNDGPDPPPPDLDPPPF